VLPFALEAASKRDIGRSGRNPQLRAGRHLRYIVRWELQLLESRRLRASLRLRKSADANFFNRMGCDKREETARNRHRGIGDDGP
jgi:hypothetical protein